LSNPPTNTTETTAVPILNYIVQQNTPRDIVLPHGIKTGNLPLYVVASTNFGQIVSDNIVDNNNALITPVQVTLSYD
jgi:hypothetical protein